MRRLQGHRLAALEKNIAPVPFWASWEARNDLMSPGLSCVDHATDRCEAVI